jgi:hypothetical protein
VILIIVEAPSHALPHGSYPAHVLMPPEIRVLRIVTVFRRTVRATFRAAYSEGRAALELDGNYFHDQCSHSAGSRGCVPSGDSLRVNL